MRVKAQGVKNYEAKLLWYDPDKMALVRHETGPIEYNHIPHAPDTIDQHE